MIGEQVSLSTLAKGVEQFYLGLCLRMRNPNDTSLIPHQELRNNIYNFCIDKKDKPAATNAEKIKLNQIIRHTFRRFLNEELKPKLTAAVLQQAQNFMETISRFWQSYQRIVFAMEHISFKLRSFFSTFYKRSDASKFNYPQEVLDVSALAVNELKDFISRTSILKNMQSHFERFLIQEREGKNVPRQLIRDAMNCLEACYFGLEATCSQLVDGKPKMTKILGAGEALSMTRKATDGKFYDQNFLPIFFKSCTKFYNDIVNKRLAHLSFSEDTTLCLQYSAEEETRSKFYIQTTENRIKYMRCVNESLVEFCIQDRLTKPDGLRKYFESYVEGQQEWIKEIRDTWQVYSGLQQKAIPIVKRIYESYLQAEGGKISTTIGKPLEFIRGLIALNSKNSVLLENMGRNDELENIRAKMIRLMLNNTLLKKNTVYEIGAKNLAAFVNSKFKASGAKNDDEFDQSYRQIVALFKILLQKAAFTREHQIFTASRLLEDLDLSKDDQFTKKIEREKQMIREIELECGGTAVQELSKFIDDINFSHDRTKQIQAQYSSSKGINLLNQIILRSPSYWEETKNYQILLPSCLLPLREIAEEFFSKQSIKIQIDYDCGVSIFNGKFIDKPKQLFQMKNIYMIILLIIDEEPSKKIFYGNLKEKIAPKSMDKEVALISCISELLCAGILLSFTKKFVKGDVNICRMEITDELEINVSYNYVEEQTKVAKPNQVVKPISYIKNSNLSLSEELRVGFQKLTKQSNISRQKLEQERKYRIERLVVQSLKQAYNEKTECTVDSILSDMQSQRNIELHINPRETKMILEDLINRAICERVPGNPNLIRYTA